MRGFLPAFAGGGSDDGWTGHGGKGSLKRGSQARTAGTSSAGGQLKVVVDAVIQQLTRGECELGVLIVPFLRSPDSHLTRCHQAEGFFYTCWVHHLVEGDGDRAVKCDTG